MITLLAGTHGPESATCGVASQVEAVCGEGGVIPRIDLALLPPEMVGRFKKQAAGFIVFVDRLKGMNPTQ